MRRLAPVVADALGFSMFSGLENVMLFDDGLYGFFVADMSLGGFEGRVLTSPQLVSL
jgi:hypothetical protein